MLYYMDVNVSCVYVQYETPKFIHFLQNGKYGSVGRAVFFCFKPPHAARRAASQEKGWEGGGTFFNARRNENQKTVSAKVILSTCVNRRRHFIQITKQTTGRNISF